MAWAALRLRLFACPSLTHGPLLALAFPFVLTRFPSPSSICSSSQDLAAAFPLQSCSIVRLNAPSSLPASRYIISYHAKGLLLPSSSYLPHQDGFPLPLTWQWTTCTNMTCSWALIGVVRLASRTVWPSFLICLLRFQRHAHSAGRHLRATVCLIRFFPPRC